MQLDIYNNSWISLETMDGKTAKTGIRDCIAQAHSIKKVWVDGCVTYMDNIAPITLMTMILARIFRPDREAKLDMYDIGEFDISAVDDYINECKLKGVSFDIFDKDKPFLQCSMEQLEEISGGKPKKLRELKGTLGKLEPFYSSGNNVLFYNTRKYTDDQTAEDQYAMTPEQYTASLIRNHMYRSASGSGHVSTGNGSQPPLTVIVNGKNLFETLLFMIPEDIKDSDLPMWERNRYDADITEYIASGNFGFLGSTLWPVEYIHYGDIENGLVKNVYTAGIYKGAEDEEKPAHYQEIFTRNQPCSLIHIKKDEKKETESWYATTLRPDTSPWLEMASSDSGNFGSLPATDFIKALGEEELIDKKRRFDCTVYGLTLSSTSIPDPAQTVYGFSFPEGLLSPGAGKLTKVLAKRIKDLGWCLKTCLTGYDRSVSSESEKSSMKEDTEISDSCRRFMESCAGKAEHKWLDMIADSPTEDTFLAIEKEAEADVMKAYDRYVPVRDDFIKQTEYRNKLYSIIHSSYAKR